jgi:hypothetical protein
MARNLKQNCSKVMVKENVKQIAAKICGVVIWQKELSGEQLTISNNMKTAEKAALLEAAAAPAAAPVSRHM